MKIYGCLECTQIKDGALCTDCYGCGRIIFKFMIEKMRWL